MSKEQIEEMACKNCIHYEVCMYVNAQAVEYARAENCKLFKHTADVAPKSEVEKIFEKLKVRECSNSVHRAVLHDLHANSINGCLLSELDFYENAKALDKTIQK